MGVYRSIYSIYGMRINDDADWFALDEDPGQCLNDGTVGYLHAGAHDHHMTFLALRWSKLEAGNYDFHSGEQANASKFVRDHWNDDLRAVADRLGLDILEAPGWYTIPNES